MCLCCDPPTSAPPRRRAREGRGFQPRRSSHPKPGFSPRSHVLSRLPRAHGGILRPNSKRAGQVIRTARRAPSARQASPFGSSAQHHSLIGIGFPQQPGWPAELVPLKGAARRPAIAGSRAGPDICLVGCAPFRPATASGESPPQANLPAVAAAGACRQSTCRRLAQAAAARDDSCSRAR